MPKAPATQDAVISPASGPLPTVLKRNQACHNCRKRKLKCDAQRPCGTCKRSHRNALAHAEPGVTVPPEPDCTYDEVVPSNTTPESGPRSRFEKLESRMRELEAMVREKEQFTQQLLQQLSPDGKQFTSESAAPSNQTLYPPGQSAVVPTAGPSTVELTMPNPVGSIVQAASQTGFATYPDSEMFFPHYPSRLPPPDLLHHLVDVFFNFYVHANRVLHRPSFQASLTLPPSAIGFPKASLLHAICAVASTYTSLVEQPPLPDYKQQAAREIFKQPQRGLSFGDLHAKYAKEALEGAIQSGDGIFEAFQSMLLLSAYNFRQAKWVESWLLSGLALRSLTPLGLNVCEPHVPLRRTLAPIFLLPAPRDTVEEEMRRNCFWLAYTMERFQTVGTGWAATLDDEDISQVMPTPLENFINGARVPPSIRQRLSTPQILTSHPHGQTDSFTLYVKSAHLLSVIKSFNHRIMAKMIPITPEDLGLGQDIDIRHIAEFHSMEQLVATFGLNVARQFRKPVTDGLIDSHLYVANIAPQLAMIVLHAPHINTNNPACLSTAKVLSACRAVLDSVFAVCNTSYDMGLLDSFCSMAWVIPAQELVRITKAQADAGDVGFALQLRGDIEVFRVALGRMGEKVPLAYRRLLILEDAIKTELDPVLGSPNTSGVEELPLSTPCIVPDLPSQYNTNSIVAQKAG